MTKEISNLNKFCQKIPKDTQVLVVVGGGTAALSYLYTKDIEPQYTHIIILGDRGYWNKACHRLAQPHHIFALPHTPSDEFVDPAAHDQDNGILPHEPTSAYVHSKDYQARLNQLEETTLQALRKQGKKVFIARNAWVKKITQLEISLFSLEIQQADFSILANKVVVATGAGPERCLPINLKEKLLSSISDAEYPMVEKMVLNYTDVLTSVSEKCRDKDVLIYGGGATAAWAMEVAALNSKPVAWVARSGFRLAKSAGPRVNAIIQRTHPLQVHATITSITYQKQDIGESKLLIKVGFPNSLEPREFLVDYLFNCIGQEPYEIGGLPEIISPEIKDNLLPYLDKNLVTGTESPSILGWSTEQNDFMIIGAALGTYYDRDQQISRPSMVSDFLPISGQVGITIASVIASVSALTNYMPFSQDEKTGKISLLSLNIHIMNATQLAVYFTAYYPTASATQINSAVTAFIAERIETDFGLAPERLTEFMQTYFGPLTQSNLFEIVKPKQPPLKQKQIEKSSGKKAQSEHMLTNSSTTDSILSSTSNKLNRKKININSIFSKSSHNPLINTHAKSLYLSSTNKM